MVFDNFFPRGRFGKAGETNFDIFVAGGDIHTLDTDEEFAWLVRTPVDPYIHFVFEFQASKNGEIRFYKEPTVSAVGTPCPCDNNNDNIEATPELLIYGQPTVTGTGTCFFAAVIGTDSTAVVQPSGGKYDRLRKRVLKRDTDYLLIFKSLTDGNRMSHLFTFAEES